MSVGLTKKVSFLRDYFCLSMWSVLTSILSMCFFYQRLERLLTKVSPPPPPPAPGLKKTMSYAISSGVESDKGDHLWVLTKVHNYKHRGFRCPKDSWTPAWYPWHIKNSKCGTNNGIWERVENIVEIGENAGHQHFLLFPRLFLPPSSGLFKI